MTNQGEDMKYLIAILLLIPVLASAETDQHVTALVSEDRFHWELLLTNCEKTVDPSLPIIVDRKKFPAKHVVVRQNKRKFKCDVERIVVQIAGL